MSHQPGHEPFESEFERILGVLASFSDRIQLSSACVGFDLDSEASKRIIHPGFSLTPLCLREVPGLSAPGH